MLLVNHRTKASREQGCPNSDLLCPPYPTNVILSVDWKFALIIFSCGDPIEYFEINNISCCFSKSIFTKWLHSWALKNEGARFVSFQLLFTRLDVLWWSFKSWNKSCWWKSITQCIWKLRECFWFVLEQSKSVLVPVRNLQLLMIEI